MMLKLKLQYFGHLMLRVDSLEKTLMLGGIEGRRRRGRQRMWWLDGITGLESEWTPGVSDWQGGLACCDSWGCKEPDTTEWLNWTELIWKLRKILKELVRARHDTSPDSKVKETDSISWWEKLQSHKNGTIFAVYHMTTLKNCQCFLKLSICIPFDPIIAFLDIYLKYTFI